MVPTHTLNAEVMPALVDRVARESGEKLSMEIAAGGTLSGPADTLATLESGAIDAAMMIYAYTPSDLPVLTFVGSLYSDDNMYAAPALLETIKLGCKSCTTEQEDAGIHVVMHSASPNYAFQCTRPISDVADLAGLNIRATGSMGPLVAALGAVPVTVSYPEIYEALQRGVIDCTVTTMTELKNSQLWEVTSDVTMAPLGTFNPYGTLVFNADVWDGFSPQVKRAWYDSAALGLTHELTAVLADTNLATRLAFEEHGLNRVEASEELIAAVEQFRASEMTALVADAREKGIEDAESIADYFFEAAEKWKGIVSEIGDPKAGWNDEQVAVYAAAIKREIYDKLDVE